MDYDYNKQYTQKSNTGFWVIVLLTIALCGYMTYTQAMGFANAGFNAIDSYAYGLTEETVENRMKSSSSAIISFIFAVLYFILLIITIICAFSKNIKILMISFVSSLVLTLIVFFIAINLAI